MTDPDSFAGKAGLASDLRSLMRWAKSPDFQVAMILLVVSFFVYLSNWRLISAGDNYPARYLPFSILKYGSLYLDPIATVTAQGDPHPFWILNRHGHAVSAYPVVVPLLVTPLYVPAVAWLNARGWTEDRLDEVARLMEKLAAALIASMSVALMYILLRRRTTPGVACLLTVAYAFGTNAWMISSQALWQHGAAQLFLLAALYLLTGACTKNRALAVGLLCGLIACNRPPDAILSFALGLYGLIWARGRKWFLLAGAAAPLALLLFYNLYFVRELVGGYARKGNFSSFQYGIWTGVAGLLFSPARGLFVFSPFLLFVPLGIKSVLSDPKFRQLDLLLLAAIIVQILCYAKLDWRAGSSWGPRWLTDILPLMIWMLVPVIANAGRFARIVFGFAVLFAIGVQAVGAFWYTGKSDGILMAEEGDPGGMKSVWDLRNTPYVLELKHEPAPRGIFHTAIGHIDTVEVNGTCSDQIPIGSEVKIEGWALTNLHTPAEATVSVMPVGKTKWRGPAYYPVVHIANFGPRPDVSEKMQSTGPSGWSVTLQTDGLDPGEHVLVVNAKPHALGEFRAAARRTIMVVENNHEGKSLTNAGFQTAAKEAASELAANQQPGGFWLTSYTETDCFRRPRMEMNTFLGAMMIDVLQPISHEAGLRKVLDDAKTHLTSQIEPNGLVRYHGLPDAPTISELGPVLAPDADDTALAWRIATGKNEYLLPSVLRILKSYRTPDGLYRTWLAPMDEYGGGNPGTEPNPVDITVQMHVLMFLDAVDKPSARELFEALQRTTGNESYWFYYKNAPLIPLLRQRDLQELGYSLKIPSERVTTPVRGQQLWVDVCKLIASDSANNTDQARTARLLLGRLAAGQFSEIKQNPPLMYNNGVGRNYWSEDFGYALWLRLYFKYRNDWAPEEMELLQ